MVIGVIRIVLAGIILCCQIVRRQIKEQPCAPVITVKATDDLVKQTFHHQFFYHDPRPDAQTAAPCIPSPVIRKLNVREVSQEVRVRVHHLRIILALLADRRPFRDVILFVRLIDPIILVVDVDHAFDRALVNFPLYRGYFYLKIVIHLTVLTLQNKCIYLLNNYTKDSPKNQAKC